MIDYSTIGKRLKLIRTTLGLNREDVKNGDAHILPLLHVSDYHLMERMQEGEMELVQELEGLHGFYLSNMMTKQHSLLYQKLSYQGQDSLRENL